MGAGCSDPPSPPALPPVVPTVALHLEWRRPDDAVRAPIVVVVDDAGGPMDSLAANSDVTTFFNDRFHPVLVPAYQEQPAGTVAFYDGAGCPIAGPARPATPDELIALANRVIVDPRARGVHAARLPERCAPAAPPDRPRVEGDR